MRLKQLAKYKELTTNSVKKQKQVDPLNSREIFRKYFISSRRCKTVSCGKSFFS